MATGPIELALPFAAALSLCALRWAPTVLFVPAFAGHALGAAGRTVLMLALALPATPPVAAALLAAPLPLAEWLGSAAKEAAIGIVLGALIAAPFWAIEAAGTYLDYQRGGNPQALDPAASVDASLLGAMFQQALIVFLMYSGGLHALLKIVWSSYAVWPVLDALTPPGLKAWPAVSALLTATMRFALTLAFPYLLALGAIETCFALLSRINARFPAYVAALPFKSVALLLLVALTLPRLLGAAADIAGERVADVRQLMRETAPAAPSTCSARNAHQAINDERSQPWDDR
jgi:type III secretion protein T